MNEYPSFAEWGKHNKDLIKRAVEFAKRAHSGVKRKFDKKPYFTHVERVANKVRKFTSDPNEIAAAYLHDTVEDVKGVTQDVIRDVFNDTIAIRVGELTSDSKMIKSVGKTSYLSIKMNTLSDKGLLIKLCDRWDNCSDFPTADEKFVEKYAKSTNEILDFIEKNRNLSKTHMKIIEEIRWSSYFQY